MKAASLLADIPDSEWKNLSEKKILFGHQSVGSNIIEGIQDLKNEYPKIQLNISELQNYLDNHRKGFIHFKVGRNMDPISKIKDFERIIKSPQAGNLDIAFFKFCWADFTSKTNIEQVFNTYSETMSALHKNFPNITFIHCTVPLTSNGSGFNWIVKQIKDVIKVIVGRTNFYDNSARNRYNEMVRRKFSGKEIIFDLAAVESGKIDETSDLHPIKQSLFDNYTDDGGHLNAKGRKITAAVLLLLLSQTSK